MNISENFKGTYGTMYYVHNMKKSVQYYKDNFNLNPEDETPEWTTFSLNGHRICLHLINETHTPEHNGVLIANVSNLEGVVSELKKRGVEFISEIKNVCEGGYAADFKDPNDNVLSLFEYKG